MQSQRYRDMHLYARLNQLLQARALTVLHPNRCVCSILPPWYDDDLSTFDKIHQHGNNKNVYQFHRML